MSFKQGGENQEFHPNLTPRPCPSPLYSINQHLPDHPSTAELGPLQDSPSANDSPAGQPPPYKALQLLWHAGCSPPENHSLESSPILVPLRTRFLGWSDPQVCGPGSYPSQEPRLRWETDQQKLSSLGILLVISPPSRTSKPLLRAHLNAATGAVCGHQAASRLLGPEQSNSPRPLSIGL